MPALVLVPLLLLAVLGLVLVVGMRHKVPAVLDAVRGLGRAMRPLALRRAGTASSPTAVVEHVGRRSGRRYETPVVATEVDGGFAIALPYGPNTDWLRNVLAAGRATLRWHGIARPVAEPHVVPIDAVNHAFEPKEQRLHRRFGVHDALLLRTTDT